MPSINWDQVYYILKFVIAGISIIGSIYGFAKFIDSRISKKLGDAEFVKGIARLLRPYAIFNDKGEVIVDRGAMSFIEDIEITMDNELLPKEITLKLKEHKATAPILLSLDNSLCDIKERRGKKFDWKYSIKYDAYSDKDERRFNVEIVT